MAFTLLHSNGSHPAGSATPSLAYATNPTAGSLLTLKFANFSDTETITNVTDTLGNTWALGSAAPSAGIGERAYIYYCLSNLSTGANTVQVNKSNTAASTMELAEWTAPAGVIFGKHNETNGSATAPTVTLSTVSANNLIVGFTVSEDDQSANLGAGYSLLLGRTDNWAETSEYNLDSGASGNIVVNFTHSTAQWNLAAVSFSPPAGGYIPPGSFAAYQGQPILAQ